MKIEGYASIFNVVDNLNDIVHPRAFDEWLKKLKKTGDKIPLLFNHSFSTRAGVVDVFKVTRKGLYIKGTVLDGKPTDDVKSDLNGGIFLGFSIGYNTLRANWINPNSKNCRDMDREIRVLESVALKEISIVNNPANRYCEVKRKGNYHC